MECITPFSPYSLHNRQALVTGGGSGLGLGIARCLVESGAKVVLTGRSEEKLKSAAQQLGPSASYILCDITDSGAVDNMLSQINRLDILVNNAGNHIKKSYEDMEVDDFTSLINTHVTAAFYLTKKCAPFLRQSENSSILFIASMASFLGIPNIIGYTAAKSAVLGLIRGTAAEYGAEGIRVNGIAPGWIKTPMTEKALAGDSDRTAKILSRTPSRRLGEPSDIGWASAYLCSDAAKFVNGHTLLVDGGAVTGF